LFLRVTKDLGWRSCLVPNSTRCFAALQHDNPSSIASGMMGARNDKEEQAKLLSLVLSFQDQGQY
jgi:hypothetical protein